MRPQKTVFHHQIVTILIISLIAVLLIGSSRLQHVSAGAGGAANLDLYRATVPNVDTNLTAAPLRQPTSLQLTALDQFKSMYGGQATVRWNSFAGSPDVMMGFHSAPSTDTPENAARAFIAGNQALFGADAASLALVDQKEALGGYMLRFEQRADGLNVAGGGLGFLMTADKQIRMVMGSTFRDVNVSGATVLDGAAAAARAQAELAKYRLTFPSGVEQQYLAPGLNELEKQIAPALRQPKLNVFPTADGYHLAWDVLTFSRNPFGMFRTQVDANTGQVLMREDLVRYQQAGDALTFQADIFPNHPVLKNPDTSELKLDAKGEPEGMKRVQLRAYDPGTNLTSVNGTLTGPHALINNVLATKQPFAQGALGTFFFRQNNAPLEAQPNERDDLAEPAEHIDDVNIFFFINYLLEYVDDIHKRGDRVHSKIGQGDFPDTYPNSDRPLVGLPHFPNPGKSLGGGSVDTTSPDTILRSALGFDNAFSLPVIETIDTPAGPQTVVVNPTVYGHGYLLNDLGKDGAVCYHEGMHSISTPIAGLEGAPEGGALNEGQADLWAYTITDAEAIGEYGIQGAGYRARLKSRGTDPDSIAYIRSVHSSLKYSHLGTYGTNPPTFEVHKDGEIYVAVMWDLRDLMKAAEPASKFVRPNFENGQTDRQISVGQETWERDFLGSLYILGLTAPDTFVKARDAMIEADRILYSTDPSDLDAPGQHEALIWQVFASHELGLNAVAPLAGRQTISTAVPQFASDQNHTAAPQGVLVNVASLKSLNISWQPASGAFAYEILKRKVGTTGQRQFKGVPGREYIDGDNATTGWTHVGYAKGTSYEDKGFVQEVFAPAGISSKDDASGFNEMFGTEYAVRALSVNSNHEVGASDLSGGAALTSSIQDVSTAISATFSNVQLTNGVFEFDQTIKNMGLSGVDSTAYAPINFQIVRISNPTVTVRNADNGGNGKTSPASFVYNESLAAGNTSAPRHLQFNDPQAQMFTFDVLVTARVRGASIAVSGSQPGDGDGDGSTPRNFKNVTDVYSGVIPASSAGSALVSGVDYVDVPFVARQNAFGVEGTLDVYPFTPAGAAPDMDFELRDDQGRVLATSGNQGAHETLGYAITPGKTYIYRVIGFANGPTPFTIQSKQYYVGADQTANGSGGFLPATPGVTTVKLMRFTVNPLTGLVSAQILK